MKELFATLKVEDYNSDDLRNTRKLQELSTTGAQNDQYLVKALGMGAIVPVSASTR